MLNLYDSKKTKAKRLANRVGSYVAETSNLTLLHSTYDNKQTIWTDNKITVRVIETAKSLMLGWYASGAGLSPLLFEIVMEAISWELGWFALRTAMCR